MKIAYKPDLSGKTAVVTGGAGVLCSEFCRAYAECGAKVAVLGRTYEKAERLASEIRASGGQAMAVSADVTSPEQLAEAHEKIKENAYFEWFQWRKTCESI